MLHFSHFRVDHNLRLSGYFFSAFRHREKLVIELIQALCTFTRLIELVGEGIQLARIHGDDFIKTILFRFRHLRNYGAFNLRLLQYWPVAPATISTIAVNANCAVPLAFTSPGTQFNCYNKFHATFELILVIMFNSSMHLIEHRPHLSASFNAHKALVCFITPQHFFLKVPFILTQQLLSPKLRIHLKFHPTQCFLLLII